jgi:hypothetical protein
MSRKSLRWVFSLAAIAITAAVIFFWPAKKTALAMPDLLPRFAEAVPSVEFLKSVADV